MPFKIPPILRCTAADVCSCCSGEGEWASGSCSCAEARSLSAVEDEQVGGGDWWYSCGLPPTSSENQIDVGFPEDFFEADDGSSITSLDVKMLSTEPIEASSAELIQASKLGFQVRRLAPGSFVSVPKIKRKPSPLQRPPPYEPEPEHQATDGLSPDCVLDTCIEIKASAETVDSLDSAKELIAQVYKKTVLSTRSDFHLTNIL